MPAHDAADAAFVREHEGLVHELARRAARKIRVSTAYDDLVGHGFVGLLEARERFDPDKGFAFSDYAHHRVDGAIWDGVRRMQHLPPDTYRYARAQLAQIEAAEQALEARGRRGPHTQLEPVGGALESLMGRVTGAILLAELDAAPATPEAEVIREHEMERVRRALATLPDREQLVLRGIYFEDRRLDEIGAPHRWSRSFTSRLHTHALELLRTAWGDDRSRATLKEIEDDGHGRQRRRRRSGDRRPRSRVGAARQEAALGDGAALRRRAARARAWARGRGAGARV
jgi:RNA polymerase sigma factor for flagellar operon FliA